MASLIPTRRPTRIVRSTNDENANAGRIGTAGAKPATKATENIKISAKDSAVKPSTRLATRPGLTQQQENLAPNKRKRSDRDALGDTTNGKGKVAAGVKARPASVLVEKPVNGTTAALKHQRASSVSTTVSTANSSAAVAPRSRQPLATKKANTTVAANKVSAPVVFQAETTDLPLPTRVTRKPVSAKPTPVVNSARTRKTHTTVVTASNSRKVTASGSVVTKEVIKIEEVETEKVGGEVDEDELRQHKRPRLSSDDDLAPAPPFSTKKAEEKIDLLKTEPVFSLAPVKPEDGVPEDLDKADSDDPLMVSEYVVEIFDYLRGMEPSTMPNPDYLSLQTDLRPEMRGILGDWLISVHRQLRLLPETIFITMNLIDRFLSLRTISAPKLQLVGVVCLMIACKYEEILSPGVDIMVHYTADACKKEEIQEAEKYVLKSVNWNMSYSSPITFLRRVSKADGFDAESRTLAKYLVELYCVDNNLLAFKSSCIAAAAMWVARLALDREEWSANLAHYSGYKEEELLDAANAMINFLLQPLAYDAIWEKYASRRFMKASVFLRSWALERWTEGSVIDLAECLDPLKELAAQRREQGVAGQVTLVDDPDIDEKNAKALREAREKAQREAARKGTAQRVPRR